MKRMSAAFSLIEVLAALAVLALLASTLAFLWVRHLRALREAEATFDGTLLLQSAHAGLLIRGNPDWPNLPPRFEAWTWTSLPAEGHWNVWSLQPASNENPRLLWPYRLSPSPPTSTLKNGAAPGRD